MRVHLLVVGRTTPEDGGFELHEYVVEGEDDVEEAWTAAASASQALVAAEAAECAAAQGRFWEMHDLLFEHQPHFKPADLMRHAAAIGLDLTRFSAELDDHLYLQRIREQIDGAHRSHVRATPTFFVNGVVHDVSFGMKPLHDHIAALLRG